MLRKVPKIIRILREIFTTRAESSNVRNGSIIKVIFCEVRIVLSALDINSTSIFLMLFRRHMKGGSFSVGDDGCPNALVLLDNPRYRNLPAYSFPSLSFLSPFQFGISNFFACKKSLCKEVRV